VNVLKALNMSTSLCLLLFVVKLLRSKLKEKINFTTVWDEIHQKTIISLSLTHIFSMLNSARRKTEIAEPGEC
jgi:hypothetical protein